MSSSQRRNRAQKHQNSTVWKADKNKSDPKTKMVSNLQVSRCCTRCTDIITWKINYGKYKPLTRPTTCNRCHTKSVKHAYHTICSVCVDKLGVCSKCGTKDGEKELERNLINHVSDECQRMRREIEGELKRVSERQRRGVRRKLERLGDFGAQEELNELKAIQVDVEEFVRKRRERKGELDEDDEEDEDSDEEDEDSDETEDGNDTLHTSVNRLKVS